MVKGGKLIEGLFKGETINTPSMLCVEDYLDALKWAEGLGGLKALIARADGNLKAIGNWVKKTEWIDFLCTEERLRSNTSVCLKIVDPWFARLADDAKTQVPKKIASLLEEERVAYDIASYRDAPPGLRVWAGSTIERAELEALFPWLDWAFVEARAALAKAA
jgi:phosphoserine aminotransferase